MKKFILAGIVMMAALSSKAAILENAASVKIVMPYRTQVSSQTIGTTAVEMTGNVTSSTATAGIRYITVMNTDATNTIYCGDSSSVASSGLNIGWPIAPSATGGPRNYFSWTIPTWEPFYCISSGSGNNVMVILGH